MLRLVKYTSNIGGLVCHGVVVRSALFFVLMLVPIVANPHGGGLDAYGCHHVRATGEYHCHRGGYSGSGAAPAYRQQCFSRDDMQMLVEDAKRACWTIVSAKQDHIRELEMLLIQREVIIESLQRQVEKLKMAR